MKKINLTIPLSIFLAGTILFLLTPVMIFGSFTTNEIFLTGIVLQIVGITASLIQFFRYQMTQKGMKEI